MAVAPVRNLTGDPERQHLVEAFTDDLVTDLFRHGRGLSLKPLGDERGAIGNSDPDNGRDMIISLPGVPRAALRELLRVNMRIVDAATSEYLSAGRHEFKPEDLAPIQTRITRRISRELHVLLLQAASRRAVVDSGMGLGVPECLSRAAEASRAVQPRKLSAEAQRWYLAALASDPRSVEALVGLALTCQYLISNPWWGDPQRRGTASDLGREAVAIALSIAPGHAVRNVSKECCTRLRDSWTMRPAPSSKLSRWIRL